jgi:hypothetical protein
MEWDWKWFGRFVGTKIGVVVGQLLDVVFDEAIDIPFEHWTGDVESELLYDVFVDLLRIRRAT